MLWPEYFNLYDVAICRALSERLDTVVSAVGLAGNDGWSHHLLRAGTVLDRFASYPLALAQHLGEVESVARAWAGDPATVAAMFGVPSRTSRPTSARPDPRRPTTSTPRSRRSPRAASASGGRGAERAPTGTPGGSGGPADPWGFTRFWELVGITYPVRLPVVANLDLVDGWDRLLPRTPTRSRSLRVRSAEDRHQAVDLTVAAVELDRGPGGVVLPSPCSASKAGPMSR